MHWVCTKSAPAEIFLAKRWTRKSKGSAKGLLAAPMKSLGCHIHIGTVQEFAFIPHGFDRMNQLHGVDVKNILGLGMVSE